MNKKAVITILGMIGVPREGEEKALYKSEISDIKEDRYINSFPALIKNYDASYDILPLYTAEAKEKQIAVLREEKLDPFEFKDDYAINEGMSYDEIFSKIDNILMSYDEIIIDVSHGYRHLPILVIVNAIMHNIESIDKIKKIIFAREDEKFRVYTFIDLKEYLDLANISYALTTFERNYTVANNVQIGDEKLKNFMESLASFSKHILANSIDELIKDINKKTSVATAIITNISNLLDSKDEKVKNLSRLLGKTKKHIENIKSFDNEINYIKLYKMSENMFKKGYLLNSITLLSEAIGMYCSWGLKTLNEEVKKAINEYEEEAIGGKNSDSPYRIYELYNQSKVFYNVNNYNGVFLKIKNKDDWNIKAEEITNIIKDKLEIKEDLRDLIRKIDAIRNNLAHANSSKRLKDVNEEIERVLYKFFNVCIETNILNVAVKTISDSRKVKEIEKVKFAHEPKKSKIKTIPTGIDAPKEQVNNLLDNFNNR